VNSSHSSVKEPSKTDHYVQQWGHADRPTGRQAENASLGFRVFLHGAAMVRAMQKQKKTNAPDFGKPSAEVNEAGAIYRQKVAERVERYQSNWPQKIPHDAEFESAMSVLVEETQRRIDILMAHYRMIADRRGNYAYFGLALHLAQEFVAGFDPCSLSVRGAPRLLRSDRDDRENLADAIEALRDKNKTIAQACKDLSKGKWKGQGWKCLQSSYYRYCADLKMRTKMHEVKMAEQKARLEAKRQKPLHRVLTLNNLFGTIPNY